MANGNNKEPRHKEEFGVWIDAEQAERFGWVLG